MSTPNLSDASPLSPNSTRKKRMACDHCSLSKVRCTGEINGCQRCQRGNKFCHYSESNMGRTMDGGQKRRKSAPRPLTATTSHRDFDEFDWTSSSSMGTSTSQIDPFWNAMGNPEFRQLTTDSGKTWNKSRNLQQNNASFPDPSRTPDLDDMDFDDIHATLLEVESPLDIGFSQLIGTSSPWLSTQQQPNTGQLPKAMESTPDVSSWTSLLEKLTRTSNKAPIALDELLHSSSTLVPRVTQALRSPSPDPSYMTSLIIILLCLTQVVALFEQCIPSLICRFTTPGSRDLGNISLHLGAFQVDREAQQALQKHIVGKELSRILQMLKLAKQALQQPGMSSAPKRTHNLLIDDLHIRIKSVVHLVKEKWKTTPQLAF